MNLYKQSSKFTIYKDYFHNVSTLLLIWSILWKQTVQIFQIPGVIKRQIKRYPDIETIEFYFPFIYKKKKQGHLYL